ncbi:hypothetical protein QP156_12820 [Staphylococcus caprae]|nr:hypothetical protein [Staphylococcus caprae]MDK6298899.1 hypothetical protein [Staphylococcus caprae]MDK7232220.1 hypothetical protein [Staphylococcus caprae]
MRQNAKKDRTIAVRVTASQHDKIGQLASIRHMSIADYVRYVAVGNRIKPTVIEYPSVSNASNESEEKSENDIETFKLDKQALQKHIHQLEDLLENVKEENEVFHRLLEHFDSTAFLNFNTYRDDRQLKNAIKHLKENR